MRVVLLLSALSALSAITTSSPMPRNASVAIPAFKDNSQPVDSPRGRHIPVAMMKCMGDKLDEMNYLTAKQNMFDWSDDGGYVKAGSMHFESYPNNYTGVTWYICNCKWWNDDRVPRWELDSVQRILEAKCGEWQSGWVWSKRWDKGFNVVPTKWFRHNLEHGGRICPPHCWR
ncbi:hypothetical protein FHL15_003468 [Xylaria flabelliformis]|uniref:Uncharacterized protein n=1 Tax=Xylaria flabelliformis TaxID=2512241 RepID=A0A553I5M8_9PEZI|nr:hypothetical protein FHL15_003468 [Xylaria flabelliformis]